MRPRDKSRVKRVYSLFEKGIFEPREFRVVFLYIKDTAKTKKAETAQGCFCFFGACDRSRTCTGLPPVPKSGASANSATQADLHRQF